MESTDEQPRNYLYIIGGYAVVLGGAYVYYRYSQSNGQRSKANPIAERTATVPRTEAAPRARRQDSDRNSEAARRRRNNRPTAPANRFEALPVEGAGDEPEEDTHDLAYAESMAKLREGNKLTSSRGKEARNKTVKQSTADTARADPEAQAAASDEADNAATSQSNSAAAKQAGVFDMLEPSAKAPSSLRIAPKEVKPTAVPEDGWATVAKPKKEPSKQSVPVTEDAETKKQRQNRKKAEATRAQVAAAEKAREVLAENQRRQARIARGEAAKDGSKQTAQAINRWNERELNGGAVQAPVVPGPEPALLDTYHQDGASSASSKDNAGSWSPVSNSTANTNWAEGLPDEQEQLRRLAEDDPNSWNTVTDKKKSKRKQPKAEGDGASTDGAVKEQPEPVKPSNTNGVNGIKVPKITGPSEGASDDGGWSVV